MTVTSFFYFLMLALGVPVYYLTPKRFQWATLLLLSCVFYCFAATPYTILFLLLSAAIAYVATLWMTGPKVMKSEKTANAATAISIVAIVLNVGIWFLLKGSSFWTAGIAVLRRFLPSMGQPGALPIAAALGMGYYTAQVIGYILDCRWGTCAPQRNFLKLFLFVCFFPQLTVGPISKYSQLQGLYEGHRISYQNICFGCQRILWGVFKKLVISDRVGLIVSGIWNAPDTYGGFYLWIAVLLYPLQIYTDFSGCMDIVMGTAELFDIHLQENFKNPFYARSTQEFWQRWHITLGAWARDYVYYPVLKSRPLQAIGHWSKRHIKSKRLAKLLPWGIGMGVLWFVMGFWHGSMRHIVGVSFWYWSLLVLGELFSPLSKKLIQRLNIDETSFSWKLMQRVRTYFLYAIGSMMFSASGLRMAFHHVKLLLETLSGPWNPWILFDGSITSLGITPSDINLIILGVFLLFQIARLRENNGYARCWIQKQLLPFRWLLWIGLLLLTVIYGLYGPQYNAAAFIYEGF